MKKLIAAGVGLAAYSLIATGCSTTSSSKSATPTAVASATATACVNAEVWFTFYASTGPRALYVDGVQIDLKQAGPQGCYGYLFPPGTTHSWTLYDDASNSGVYAVVASGTFTTSCVPVRIGPGC